MCSLERDGMPDYEYPCESTPTAPCRDGDWQCEYLRSGWVKFRDGEREVFWCANPNWYSLDDIELFDYRRAEGRRV